MTEILNNIETVIKNDITSNARPIGILVDTQVNDNTMSCNDANIACHFIAQQKDDQPW